jgi:hypothetical protein
MSCCLSKKEFVHYSGIGANPSHKHTKEEFVAIMKQEFQDKQWGEEIEMYGKEQIEELNYKDWILPDDFCFFSLEDWLDYSGAEIRNK